MSDNLIPVSVREFITNNIDSIAELEALLLLRRESQGDWTVPALAGRLYTSQEQTHEIAAKLHLRGLFEMKPGNPVLYRYQPASRKLEEAVNDVAEAYSKYLVPVTNLIHSKPESKIQQFADAFKLRKRRDE